MAGSGYQFRDSLKFCAQKKSRIMLLKMPIHSMAGCVNFYSGGACNITQINGDHSVLKTTEKQNTKEGIYKNKMHCR